MALTITPTKLWHNINKNIHRSFQTDKVFLVTQISGSAPNMEKQRKIGKLKVNWK